MAQHGWHWRTAWLVIGVLLLGGITLSGRSRALRAGESVGHAARPTPFLLTVDEGLLSLWAQDTPLKAIIEEIGRQLHIETVVQITPEARVTMAFDHLSLVQAIKELRKHANIAYLERAEGEERAKIGKIVAYPKRAGGTGATGATEAGNTQEEARDIATERGVSEALPTKEAPRSGGFRFGFDPSQFMQPGR